MPAFYYRRFAMSDDQSLLFRYVRSRDAEAFAQLVHRYSTLVFSVASRVTGNTATAEDVTQDCFLVLARKAPSIHGSLPAWLHRVALNRSLHVTQNEAARRRHEAKASLPTNSDFEPTWNQISPLIDAALLKLPDELREPLVQHFLLGQTQTQIAENLHIGQATVSRRLQEGVDRLRAYLKQTGIVCGAAALSTALVKNASAAVPARLAASLAKIALAGPGAIGTTASIATVLVTNAKLIAAVTLVVVVGAVLTYQIKTFLYPTSEFDFTPRSYLSKLVLQSDGYTPDSFSLAFQAAAKVLGRDADYETVYALSTNAFCPAIYNSNQNPKAFWHIQAWLGSKGIQTLSAHYGLVVEKLNSKVIASDVNSYNRALAPIVIKAMDAGKVVLIDGGWSDGAPVAGIITDAHPDGIMYGARFNGKQDNPVAGTDGIWSLAPAAVPLSPHEADIATLRLAVARIRGKEPFQPGIVMNAQVAYGLKAMDFWIKEMSETPGFCTHCMGNTTLKWNQWGRNCAYLNAQTTQAASKVAARYLRRIAPDFPPPVQSHLESAAARYDHIAAILTPALADTGPGAYSNILGDLTKQKAHVTEVLYPVKSEYSAIAQDLELAIKNLKP
jgi:RNA polymerase sigma factor (sigma-70 family)